MHDSAASEWQNAYKTELEALCNDLKAWKSVKQTPDLNVLPSSWAFKLPYFFSKEVKSTFLCSRLHSKERNRYFETWSTVQ